jgi:Family of unknown function (DUF5681)
LSTLLADALNEKIQVQEKGVARSITAREVIAKRLTHEAMKGDHRSINLLLSYDSTIPASAIQKAPEPAEYNDQPEDSLTRSEREQGAQRAYLKVIKGMGSVFYSKDREASRQQLYRL